MTPEQKARQNIDLMLQKAGWTVQDMKQFNPAAAIGVAVREFPTDVGPADYILFVNKQPVGVIEAKKEEEGERLTVVEDQSGDYAKSKLKWRQDNRTLPFVYESTGLLTHFTDNRDPKPRSRRVFHFHKPETLLAWCKQEETLRKRLQHFPLLQPDDFRDCQIRAITNLEKSFADNRPRALIQMATGSGKTFTAISSIYRLLKFAKAKRILFLVDTKNLGEQAEQEFMAFKPQDDQRKFTELYSVQRLKSSYVSKDSQVCISTIQRMYSILRGEELDESVEETSLNELQLSGQPKEVSYNPAVPVEFFDFIVIDECHRSIYNLWKQVLDYFDAFLIGLTATPDKRTFGFFNENIVSEYTHEQAVADGVNVGYDVYTIETEITGKGSHIVAKEYVDKRNRLTRRKRWEQMDEDLVYSGKQLDREVVNFSQIRNIIRAFKEKLFTEIFPNRKEVPKTLIFAKTDIHADDIIQIVREEFNEGNNFCKKITYQTTEDPKSILASFRNDYYPRVAVTVDMIATGTDVKPLECLLFMRDVKSRNYFEQMKGRGTRTLGIDDLKKVTPSVTTNKTHFVMVDAIGVCKSLKTESRPLERKKSVSVKDLMMSVAMGARDEDTLTSLANRITRIEKEITPAERQKFTELAGGKTINQAVHDLLNAFDPDKVEAQARVQFGLDEQAKPTEEQTLAAGETLVEKAADIFNKAELRTYIENVHKSHEQVIDVVNIDQVKFTGWNKDAKAEAEATIQSFREFIEKHKNEITALKIFYNQPYARKELTYRMIKELYEALQQPPHRLTIEKLWNAYTQLAPKKVKSISTTRKLIDIISLLRYELNIDSELQPYADTVNRNFRDWVFSKNAGHVQFTEEQMDWLRMIKDHIATSVNIDPDSFEYAPFDGRGGVGKLYQLFGEQMNTIIDELNEALAA